MWFILPVYILIVVVIAIVELYSFRHSHASSTIAVWTILYFAFDLALCMMANLGVTNNLKVCSNRQSYCHRDDHMSNILVHTQAQFSLIT